MSDAAGTCTLRGLLAYFLKLGATGFGGPVALVGAMQRDLVEERRWFTPEEYRQGLALAQLAPGPLAAQLAMYLGWARGGAGGAALVGLAFVLPSFGMVVVIGFVYLRFGGLPWMRGAFYGIGAAVIAIIAKSAVKLTRLTLGGDPLLWALGVGAGVVTAWTESEVAWVFVGAGLVTLLVRAWPFSHLPRMALAIGVLPSGLMTGLAGTAAPLSTLGRIGWYFAEAGSFVFGSGLAIVPFLHAGVVQEFRWLDERQFLDAVAVAMITPGPVVITVGFIGYLVAGFAGAVMAALGTFLPCYLFTVIPAPHFKRLSQNHAIKAFVDGVTAAATGAIAGAVFVLGRRALVDQTTVVVALVSLVVLTRFKRVPEPLLIAAAGLLGVALAGSVRGAGGETMRPADRSPTVVFVCTHGSARSLVAASWFDRMAKEGGLTARAVARGTVPDAAVPAAVVQSMRADGFELATFRPEGLSESDVASATRVIAMGVDLGPMEAKAGRVEHWDDIPPVSEDYPAARAALRSRLTTLLGELRTAGPLRLVQTVPLPGVKGRIDHLAVDVAGQRLFVAALGNDTVEVIDLRKGERIRSIGGLKEPQGLAYIPEASILAVASGGDGTVAFFDGVSLAPEKRIALGDDADNLRYDPARKRLYVGYGAGALGILDPVTRTRLGDVTLDAHPESFQLDPASERIFVNVASRQNVAVIEVGRNAVTATWPVNAGSANFPMALDGVHHRLFVATRRPPHVVVFSTETGTTVATLDADGDADDLFYDDARSRLYGCFGSGSVVVYGQTDSDHYTVLARIPTAAGARTGLFSAALRRLFVAVPHRASPTAEIRVFDTGP